MRKIFKKIKLSLYFIVADYFRFFARIYLWRWNPDIIMVTGSSGKTTLLHLLESEIGDLAKYSHHANSTFGIPFNILGLERKSFKIYEWLWLFLMAPIKVFSKVPGKKIYVIEADAERPGEAKSIASLVKPNVVIWLSLAQAHGSQYDEMVKKGIYKDVYEALAYEYGYNFKYVKDLVIVREDNEYIIEQLKRLSDGVDVSKINLGTSNSWKIVADKTIINDTITIPALVPYEVIYSVKAIKDLFDKYLSTKYSGLTFKNDFNGFVLPPGRSTVFNGIKGTKIIDSSYNATVEGVKAMLNVLHAYNSSKKIAIIGDMLEQGLNEKIEHENIAKEILKSGAKEIVLIGSRVKKYTFPAIEKIISTHSVYREMLDVKFYAYEKPGEALDTINGVIKGGEVILVKGARYLEGVVESLLLDKKQSELLCRREAVWINKRKSWYD